MDILEMRGISKSFFNNKVLDNVNLTLRAGEIHCLAGENGAGKSTIIKVLTGVHTDYTGEIFVEGEPVRISSPLVSKKVGIFAVQQHRDLVPTMNAVENIFLGNYILNKSGSIDMAKMREKAQAYFEEFGLDVDLDVPISELKVGVHGIIAICKALEANGKILIMDEASAPLDSYERQVLYDLLKKLRNEGKGIIYISHHLEELFAIGDRITVLRNGQNTATFTPDEIDRAGLISAMTGNKKLYESEAGRKAKERTEDMVPRMSFKNVCTKELNDISFDIYDGEIIGFAGIVGSGKETIADIAFGLVKPTSGSITFEGAPYTEQHPIGAIRKGVGLVPTDRMRLGLLPCRSVAENATLPKINQGKTRIISKAWMSKLAKESVESLGIKTTGINQLVEYLSGGNQQKVLIGKWIHTKSRMLFLVEPTEGIDVGARGDIYQLLKDLSEQGISIAVFSSDIDELMTLSDRIYTMTEGRIYAEYLIQDADKEQILSDILTKQIDIGELV